jgi:hypothetical protein
MAQPPKAVLGVGVPVEMMGNVKGSSAATSSEASGPTEEGKV